MKRNYNYFMSEVEYDEYLENYLSNFITKDYEQLTLDIHYNCLDAEYLMKVVNQLDNSFVNYNLIFEQILEIKSKGLEDINEVKKVAICKLLELKKIGMIMFILKEDNYLSHDLNNYFDEDMLTSLLFQIINLIKNNINSFIFFEQEPIFKQIINFDCFNNFHKKLLLQHLNKNNLIEKIMLENHTLKQNEYIRLEKENNLPTIEEYFKFN